MDRYSICCKDGYVYRCTSVCTLKVSKTGGDMQKTSMSYVEAAGWTIPCIQVEVPKTAQKT
ncbi:MAG: hypothetical protein IJT52_06340 [Spirochaetales bacterium]|nr:hypothetical protein [Spirochaetales bacterium]